MKTKIKKFLKSLILVFVAMLTISHPAIAADMPDTQTLDFYNRNGIYYYNPNGSCDNEEKPCSRNDGTDLTVIGDSILADEATKEKMKAKFDKLSDDNYDAKVSRTWQQGLEVARGMKLKGAIIYELGTNNSAPGLNQKDIDNLLALAGQRTIVLVTNYGTAAQYQAAFNQNNSLFKKNADANDKIIVADWASKAAAENATMDSMTVHPADNAARDLLVDVIYEALNSNCAAGRAVSIQSNTREANTIVIGQ